MDSIQFFNFPSGNTCEARIMYQAVEQGVGGDFSSQETSNEGHEEQREQVKCVVCEVSWVLRRKLKNRSCPEVLGPGGYGFT